jgi:hypothetical protein
MALRAGPEPGLVTAVPVASPGRLALLIGQFAGSYLSAVSASLARAGPGTLFPARPGSVIAAGR